jgi:nicotinate phosphoribosyltransferase
MEGDVLTVEGDVEDGEALIRPVMADGKRIAALPPLADVRAHCAGQLSRLPERLRRLEPGAPYRAEVAGALRDLADDVDRATR